jgi:hypothetical protein
MGDMESTKDPYVLFFSFAISSLTLAAGIYQLYDKPNTAQVRPAYSTCGKNADTAPPQTPPAESPHALTSPNISDSDHGKPNTACSHSPLNHNSMPPMLL